MDNEPWVGEWGGGEQRGHAGGPAEIAHACRWGASIFTDGHRGAVLSYNGEEGCKSQSGSPSYLPIYCSRDRQYSPSDLEGYRTHSEGVARRALLEPGQKLGIVRKRPDNEDTSPERGGEEGQGSDESRALRKRRLRMEDVGQVAEGPGVEVDSTEEEVGTGRAPTGEERVRREGFVALAEYNWRSIRGAGRDRDLAVGPQHARRAGPAGDEIADEVESFLGSWPMLWEMLDAQAGRGVSQRAGRQERRAARLTCEIQALPVFGIVWNYSVDPAAVQYL